MPLEASRGVAASVLQWNKDVNIHMEIYLNKFTQIEVEYAISNDICIILSRKLFLSVPNYLANCLTDMFLLYSEASYLDLFILGYIFL